MEELIKKLMRYKLRFYKDKTYQVISEVEDESIWIDVGDKREKIDMCQPNIGEEVIEFQGTINDCETFIRMKKEGYL